MVKILHDDDPDAPPTHAEQNGQTSSEPDFNLILGAPDFSTLIKQPKTQKARAYERKVASAFKTITIGSINAGNFPDAAALLWHGPSAATAVGELADADEHVAKAIDMLTSPNSPWLAFAMTVIPLVAQLARNHESELQEIPAKWKIGKRAREARKATPKPQTPPRFTLSVFGRKIPVRFKVRFKFLRVFTSGVRAQTQEPALITSKVFSDPKLQTALQKLGVQIQVKQATDE